MQPLIEFTSELSPSQVYVRTLTNNTIVKDDIKKCMDSEYQRLQSIIMNSVSSETIFDTVINKFEDYFGVRKSMEDIKDKHKRGKGRHFEKLCLLLIKTGQIVHFRDFEEGYLLEELPSIIREELGLLKIDMGIDLVVRVKRGWIAVQCKYKDPRVIKQRGYKKVVGWKELSTFHNLCDRTAPLNPWIKRITMTTGSGVRNIGNKNDKDVTIAIGTFRAIARSTWLLAIGDSGNTLGSTNISQITNDNSSRLDQEKNKMIEARLSRFSKQNY